jgi:hypothetical protein
MTFPAHSAQSQAPSQTDSTSAGGDRHLGRGDGHFVGGYWLASAIVIVFLTAAYWRRRLYARKRPD